MTDYLMILVIACGAVVAITYKARDTFGPELTGLSQAVSLVSIGVLFLWVAGDWISGSNDQWFTTMAGALPLATIELACVILMTLDTLRGLSRQGVHRRR
jgi:TRAP-type C4-dicarboxylate transport system permease small subunit